MSKFVCDRAMEAFCMCFISTVFGEIKSTIMYGPSVRGVVIAGLTVLSVRRRTKSPLWNVYFLRDLFAYAWDCIRLLFRSVVYCFRISVSACWYAWYVSSVVDLVILSKVAALGPSLPWRSCLGLGPKAVGVVLMAKHISVMMSGQCFVDSKFVRRNRLTVFTLSSAIPFELGLCGADGQWAMWWFCRYVCTSSDIMAGSSSDRKM